MSLPEGFSTPGSLEAPLTLEIPVQWGEMDALGHVNHTRYLTWSESARFAYFDRVGVAALTEHERIGPILAHAEIDYMAPVEFGDTVWANQRVIKLGRTSMTMTGEVWSTQRQQIVFKGRFIVVMVDYTEAARPTPIPEPIRAAISAMDGLAPS